MNAQNLPPRKVLAACSPELVACGVIHEIVKMLRIFVASLCNGQYLSASVVAQLRKLDDSTDIQWQNYAMSTPIAQMIAELTRYAQRKSNADRWELWMPLVCDVVLRPTIPPEPWRTLEDYLPLLDRSSEFGAVAKAGVVSFGVDHGQSATVDDLALLTGLSDEEVRAQLGGAAHVGATGARELLARYLPGW